jgi:hypothetical protein
LIATRRELVMKATGELLLTCRQRHDVSDDRGLVALGTASRMLKGIATYLAPTPTADALKVRIFSYTLLVTCVRC